MKLNKKLQRSIAGLLVVVTVLTAVGCSCNTTVRQDGYSGAVYDGNNVYFATSKGEIVSLNRVNGNRVAEDIEINNGSAAVGLLSCGMAGKATVIYSTPYISNDNKMYVSGYDGNVYCIDLITKAMNSVTLDTDKKMSIISDVVPGDSLLYVGCTDGCLYAIDPVTLETKWSYETGDKLWTSPVVVANTVYIGSFDKYVYALDATTGDVKWKQETDGAIIASPFYNDGVLYVGTFGCSFYCFDAESGEKYWEFPTEMDETKPGKWFWADPVMCGPYLVCANTDGFVYVLDPDTGRLKSSYELGASISSSPAVFENSVLVITEVGQLYSINLETGAKTLLHDFKNTCHADLTVDGEIVYVHTQSEESLFAVNVYNGLVVWYYEV